MSTTTESIVTETMNIGHWITITSVFLVIIGWFISSHLNRKMEVFKKRFDYLMDMYESYVFVAKQLETALQSDIIKQELEVGKFLQKLQESQVKFLMLGTEDEINDINKIVELARKNNIPEMKRQSAVFIASIRKKMRETLGVDKIFK